MFNFGNWLINARREKKISRQELANLIHVTYQHMYKLENNLCDPSFAMFLTILDALGYELNIKSLSYKLPTDV